jgi:hypothetical protein
MRRAQSFPCPFCTATSEKRKTAQAHARTHFPKPKKQGERGITFTCEIAVDVGRHDATLHSRAPIRLDDGTYRVSISSSRPARTKSTPE